jgi:hypothetical protein
MASAVGVRRVRVSPDYANWTLAFVRFLPWSKLEYRLLGADGAKHMKTTGCYRAARGCFPACWPLNRAAQRPALSKMTFLAIASLF